MMDNDLKITTYQKLKSILNEGDLTEKGSKNLDKLLGIEKKPDNFFQKLFKKFDSLIFKKPEKISNNPHKRLR